MVFPPSHSTTIMVYAAISLTLILAARAESPAVKLCTDIASVMSHSSAVFWPGSFGYAEANSHWANSSSEFSACAVEPGTAADLSTILKLLGHTRTPFGVKGGGHIMNPGFSSTCGVQISLSRFSKVEYDAVTSTAHIGSGLIWDDVYSALQPHNVIVPGGRISGIGVGGFALGGGYSWKANQVGLTIDTIVAHDLVLPNGTQIVVTDGSHPDLFFALKGGYNNFGIITGFTFKAFPQTQVWGGYIIYSFDHFDAIEKATANFSANNMDPKASLITSLGSINGSRSIAVLLFYDSPNVANGVFDEFLALESLSQDVSTRTYLSLVQAMPNGGSTRGAFHTVALLELSPNIIEVIANETSFWGTKLQSHSGAFFAYALEPFHGLSTHATPSAYPHDTSLLPLNLFFGWADTESDTTFINAIKESAQRIYDAAVAEGQDISIEGGKQIRYPNYALYDTPLNQLYGKNVPKLRHTKALYDPHDVMSLTGGFKI